ncbi:hypothetical protein [Lentibacillus salinarum]|uniref:Uncharacterized protein n=1 Tax=Lentibacillus salinarum TaxID=446820 RepID=A0ABW3ZWJ2_9BACI
MATKTGVKKAIRIGFSLEEMAFQEDIVDIQPNSDYKTFCNLIGADFMDVVPFDDEFDIAVDDEGLMVSGNPVIEIQTEYGTQQLAGTLLFLKKKFTNDGIDLIGFEAGETFNLMLKLESLKLEGKIKVTGKTA